ncbi:hypothetical protein BCR34DRAFT_591066 [Clohesyomyces aquaticus]|uniref:NmrA-like domain-containing protein n=1 Tax=Clohesyomyces aquaticus TaxID=1231657 RepID=A0A1Y1Z3L3_9PLEO|nr:hypothetical protein BCR34DRAFT_591066 [Clohesyomyces aquaticus]
MTKIIAITGGTGAQGGAVARAMLKAGWKVRVVARNSGSDKAKELTSQGAEVVEANLDDEDSLVKAFKGAHAIFGVTNFWEHLFTGKTQAESGTLEAEQSMKLARAASKTSTLEHYIWSTLPNAKNSSNGKAPVPHFDYKADVDDRIRAELPDLAKKTTYLWLGFYPTNLAFFPMVKPIEYPGAYGKWVQMLPTPADALIPVSGDMNVTPGVWVRQILANPELSKGKYTMVAPEVLSFAEMLKIWSEVTGRPAVYVECSFEAYEELWGIGGKEIGVQFKYGEVVSDWTKTTSEGFVSMKELGITEEEAPGMKKALEGLKAFL